MVYAEELSGKQEEIILSAFLKGCHRERLFTKQQIEVFPYLYAIVPAFWLMNINRIIFAIEDCISTLSRYSVSAFLSLIHI